MWSPGLDPRDGDSSVSSGRLSGSSGGHESCTPFHGPWKERPPLVLGPRHQLRKTNPRLEQLRDKIRAQAQRQASCASLGTSVPSSASCFYKASSPKHRRKTPKVTNTLPAPTRPGQWLLCPHAEHRGEDRVPLSLGRELSRFPLYHLSVPRTSHERIKSASSKREARRSPTPCRAARGKGADKTAIEGSSALTCLSRPACIQNDQPASQHTSSLASRDQSATIQAAMAILKDLRQQIQAGLELARRPRVTRKLIPSKRKSQSLAGRRQQGPQSTQDIQDSLSKNVGAVTKGNVGAVTKGKCSSPDRARGIHIQQHWSPLAERESCPQRAWVAQWQDTSFQRPGNPPEKLSSFLQRPWSALAGQTYPQRSWAAQGQDISFHRPGSPPEKLSSFSQRPHSALAGQASSQRAWETCNDQKVPGPSLWSSLDRPRPAFPRPWNSSFVKRSSLHSKGRSGVSPPSKVKQAWPEPTQGVSQNPPDTQESPPRPRPRGLPGQPHSSESLRDFMRQKAQARRQQVMEQKAAAAHTLELRNRRLQEVYRKQQEAVLGKVAPVVSQRSPGIVTFVPSSAQPGNPEAPGNMQSPQRKWSKVTPGMVLGDQEAPDSFCLCLNRPWNCTETLDTKGPRNGYKQARLQALETMADILNQRIDILMAELHRSTSPVADGNPAPDVLSLGTSTGAATFTLTAPTHPGALASNKGQGRPQDWVHSQARPLLSPACSSDDERLPQSPSWELQSLSPGAHLKSQPQGLLSSTPALESQVTPHIPTCHAGSSSPEALSKVAMEQRHWELEMRLQREMAALQALSDCTRSSLGVPVPPDPARGSLWLKEMPEAKGADSVMPWTTRSCGKGEPADRPWAGWSGGQGGLPWASSTA
ncbi:coiled-coil domain-containing protein 187 [Nannospalax galili]|uniref:coiled-coil domain-containing protein 187 n=1 Tax=Nannospalax galili TaxID=1026970 RepID=UPI0004ED5AB3|nr:coiled-coil domain-containing protein 187 [Nannospalax galili]